MRAQHGLQASFKRLGRNASAHHYPSCRNSKYMGASNFGPSGSMRRVAWRQPLISPPRQKAEAAFIAVMLGQGQMWLNSDAP